MANKHSGFKALGDLYMSHHYIDNLPPPLGDLYAARKKYVDETIPKALAGAKAYLNARQLDTTNNVWQRVDFDSEVWDIGGDFNTGNLGTGTATGTTANHLIDAGYDFAAAGITVGMRIKNTTDNTYTYITAVAVGDLTLRDNIFVNGENWQVLAARFVAPVAGYYLAIPSVHFYPTVVDTKYGVAIYVSGVFNDFKYDWIPAADIIYVNFSSVLKLEVNDFVELWYKQVSGGNLVDLLENYANTRLTIILLQKF